jgi:hypothetical protein
MSLSHVVESHAAVLTHPKKDPLQVAMSQSSLPPVPNLIMLKLSMHSFLLSVHTAAEQVESQVAAGW